MVGRFIIEPKSTLEYHKFVNNYPGVTMLVPWGKSPQKLWNYMHNSVQGSGCVKGVHAISNELQNKTCLHTCTCIMFQIKMIVKYLLLHLYIVEMYIMYHIWRCNCYECGSANLSQHSCIWIYGEGWMGRYEIALKSWIVHMYCTFVWSLFNINMWLNIGRSGNKYLWSTRDIIDFVWHNVNREPVCNHITHGISSIHVINWNGKNQYIYCI